jgi:acetoin:2,6-dichlorophenolindophenol oxidoreductase subunit alpha
VIKYKYKGQGYENTDISKYPKEFIRNLFYSMLRIRMIEEVIESKYHEDQMKSPIHLVIGQEATSVGACVGLEKSDHIYSSHRTHGNYLAKGGDLKGMMSELFCRDNGCCGSRGGSMHLVDKSVGMMSTSAIVAGIIPIASGAALASKMKDDNRVIGVFFGDAAIEEGVFWESLNFSVLKKLPIIYLCENNFYSVCSPLDERQPDSVELFNKAAGFGINSIQIDATNVINVYEAVLQASKRARNGDGPTFIENIAYRWRGHGGAGDDSKSGYRGEDEVDGWQAFCPVKLLQDEMIKHSLIDETIINDYRKKVQVEIDEAFEYAINSPNPSEQSLMQHVYAE